MQRLPYGNLYVTRRAQYLCSALSKQSIKSTLLTCPVPLSLRLQSSLFRGVAPIGDLALSCCCYGYSSAWPLPHTCAACPEMTKSNPGHPTFILHECGSQPATVLPLDNKLHCLWVWLSCPKHSSTKLSKSPGSPQGKCHAHT